MIPLAGLTFADSARGGSLSPQQQLIANLPVLSEVAPGSPLLGSMYERALLMTTYAGDDEYMAVLCARTTTGRIVSHRSLHTLQRAQTPVEARQQVMAAHAANLARRADWLSPSMPAGLGVISATDARTPQLAILAWLGPDPSRLRQAFALADKLYVMQVGMPTTSCALALVGADPFPSDVSIGALKYTQGAGPKSIYHDSSRDPGLTSPTAIIDLRGEPESDWYVGLEQGSPTNPLLRVLAEHAGFHLEQPPTIHVIARTGEQRRFQLVLDPEQPHGTFTCKPVAAPAATLSRPANGVRP